MGFVTTSAISKTKNALFFSWSCAWP